MVCPIGSSDVFAAVGFDSNLVCFVTDVGKEPLKGVCPRATFFIDKSPSSIYKGGAIDGPQSPGVPHPAVIHSYEERNPYEKIRSTDFRLFVGRHRLCPRS